MTGKGKMSSTRDGPASIKNTKWAIVGNGPSMMACLDQIDPLATVVAVNHAVKCSEFHPVHVLCMYDPPHNFPLSGQTKYGLEYLMPFFQPGMRVWSPVCRKQAWELMFVGGNNFDGWERAPIMEYNDFHRPFARFGDEAPRHEPIKQNLSMMMAIRGALHGGAEEIDLFGCDMDGNGNAVQGVRKNSQKSRGRWKREREMIEAITKVCSDVGIRIRRILPEDSGADSGGAHEAEDAGAAEHELQEQRAGAVPDEGGGDGGGAVVDGSGS